VNDARAEGELLQHMADTVNRYIEVDANEGVIRERIARAFSMMAATYDRRDWPTPAVLVEAVRKARPQISAPSQPKREDKPADHDAVMAKLERWRAERLGTCTCAICEAQRQEMEAAE